MAERKPFLLRVDPKLLAALQKWADDELRSLNAQIEFLLRRALREEGRTVEAPAADAAGEGEGKKPAAHGRGDKKDG